THQDHRRPALQYLFGGTRPPRCGAQAQPSPRHRNRIFRNTDLMATVIVALGSNVGDRHKHLSDAKAFLRHFSESDRAASSIYIPKPITHATRNFYNAAIALTISDEPHALITKFKRFEAELGRPADHPKWSARTIDLVMISYDHLVIQTDTLIIPHPEFEKRLFVLI